MSPYRLLLFVAVIACGLQPVAAQTIVSPADPPSIVKPDGAPANTGETPRPAIVQETQPAGGPTAPPNEKPDLSAPVPPPEAVPFIPQVRYFVLIFSSESVPKRARFTHTWYTIVKASPKSPLPEGYDPAGNQIKYYDVLAHTISWMPRSLRIRVLKLRAEPGVNLSLHDSIRYANRNGQVVAMWGPYEVNPLVAEELYEKSVKQIARLNGGRVLYKALDPDFGPSANYVFDCIHAVSDLDGPGRRSQYDERRRFGMDAGRYLATVMARANRLDTSVVHEWVAEALELNGNRIRRRTIGASQPAPPSQMLVTPAQETIRRR
jgi:hypothetical protein